MSRGQIKIVDFLKWLAAVILLGVSVFSSRYWVTGGFSFLSRFSDLSWLRIAGFVLGELHSSQSLSPSLFAYTIAFLKGFVKDAFLALETTLFLFHLTLVGAVFFVTVSLVRSWKAGVLAGVLLALHPWIMTTLRASAYSVIAGLAWLTIALYVSIIDSSDQILAYLTLVALSVLAAASDPYAGLVLVAALILRAAIRVNRVSLRRFLMILLASLPGGLTSVALLLFHKQGFMLPDITLEPAILTLTLLTSFFGGILLYARRNLRSLEWLMSWLIASVAVPPFLNAPFSTAVGLFALPPLLILASTLLLNVDRGIVRILETAASNIKVESGEKREAEKLLEVDVTKLFSAVLLALLLFSGLMGGYGMYAEVNAAYGLERERYGDAELLEALNWISENTPKHAVVVAEYPLGDWVEAITGRETLSNRLVDFRIDPEGFQRSYAADSILNANYEIRNAFLRLRDWGPTAPQRVPYFAVSDGERFIDFLYVDESHAKVTYIIGGSSFTPNFYQYAVLFSGWVKRSSDMAVLRHVYEVDGALINKTIWLSRGKAEASIEYIIEAKPGVSLQEFSLKAWIPWSRRLGYIRVSGLRVELSLDVGNFLISFGGDVRSVDFRPDEEWAQQRAEAKFAPVKNRIYAKMVVKALAAKPIAWGGDEVTAYSMGELMAQYHVAYVIVPTIVKMQMIDRFGLDFPTFVSMFENSKLTVYKVIISTSQS